MYWLSLLTVLLTVTCSALGQEREDGILYNHTGIGLRPFYPSWPMKNHDYPNQAPHDLVQTWRWVAMKDEEHKVVALKIKCDRLYIPKMPGKNDCGLTLEEGGNTRKLCGDLGRFTYISATDDIKFEFRSGPNGGGIVDCTAEVVPVTSDRREITTTTTTTPKPTRPAYLTYPSEELDSTEHGGQQGNKATTCPCGWANKAKNSFSRIINGTETDRNEFPFAAGLAYRENRGRFCGATIITRYHALTATHCTDQKKAEELALLVGIHNIFYDWDGPVDEINIERIVDHAEYKRGIFINDISLLIMEREIQFNQYVGPACLPPSSPSLQIDRQYIKIIGWGAVENQGYGSPVLNKVDVRVVPMKECNYEYSHINVTNPTQICTYRTRKGACQGDSGGPVMWVDPETNRYTHVGIVSFGRICGDTAPTVHTRVQAYLPWIYHYIKASNKPNSQTCTKIN